MSITEDLARQLRSGQIFIQIRGLLIYEDIFGDGHRTPFRLTWKSIGDDDGGKRLTRSFWMDYSPVHLTPRPAPQSAAGFPHTLQPEGRRSCAQLSYEVRGVI